MTDLKKHAEPVDKSLGSVFTRSGNQWGMQKDNVNFSLFIGRESSTSGFP